MLTEPMTLATDYVLAAANAYFGFRLVRGASQARRYWGAGFLALAVSAVFGGSFHGFKAALDDRVLAVLWQVTEFALGLASLLLLLGIAHAALNPGPRRWLVAFAVAKFLVFAALAAVTDDYTLAIADTSVTMMITLAVSILRLRSGESFARWLIAGIAVSGIAAGVQAAGVTPHAHFNHNDLYHVIQLLGTYLLYRGGMLFGSGFSFLFASRS